MISCSPASDAVMSLHKACRAGGGRPEERHQRQSSISRLQGQTVNPTNQCLPISSKQKCPSPAVSLIRARRTPYRAMIAKWCCTAGACLLGQQWGRRQQQGFPALPNRDGTPQLSAGPASRGRLPPYSPRFAGKCTWNCAGRSGFSEAISPPATNGPISVGRVGRSTFTFCDYESHQVE